MPNTRRRQTIHSNQAVATDLSIADLDDYLTQTLNRRTKTPLADSFRIPFTEQVAQYQAAYRDGALGYDVDVADVRFPNTRLDALRQAIEHNLVNGVVLLAYPTGEQLRTLNERARGLAFHTAVPASVFLIEHLRQRGFSYFGITPSFDLRCSDRLRKELCKTAKENVGKTDTDVLRATYDRLKPPPSLDDRLGYQRLAFTSIDSLAPWERRRATYASACIDTNLSVALSLLTPEQFFALQQRSTPGDSDTYLARDAGEWLAGLTPDGVTYARADVDGFGVYKGDPTDWITCNRLRAVLK
jgi:hypothetical protein